MLKICSMWLASVSFCLLLSDIARSEDKVSFPPGWSSESPRQEIRPDFSYDPHGGPKGTGAFVISHDHREGLDGWMQKSFDVSGGDFVRFQALRKLNNVELPRRSALVRVLWQSENGRMVSSDVPEAQAQKLGHVPTAEPEHPVDGPTNADGWTTVHGIYRVPKKATKAIVELHLQWAPNGSVQWSEIEFVKNLPPLPRKVRLASVHFKPSGTTARENCEQFAPFISQAAQSKADLIVLGETVPSASPNMNRQQVAETAEPIPGPSTDYFGKLAKEHQTHIVLSLYERDRHLIYNTAVLMGPNGQLIGKYRKVCLPHGEVEKGVAPGNSYPVFETSFGKVGMMVCYDGFFPEVARELSNRGAEIIAWPVWGCNPLLAKARACENHVYVVSSTFMQPKDGWMLSAVYDRTGEPIAVAETWGTVAIAEVELSQPYIGPWNLGDFRAMIERHRPMVTDESKP
jgi:predicted amidohydrolase